MNATLGDVRGKIILWRRFPRGGHDSLNYADPFALDLTPLNEKYGDTPGAGWYTPVGGYSYVQDRYAATTYFDKLTVWYNTQSTAYESRWMVGDDNANRQFINFTALSGDLVKPSAYARVMNQAVNDWLYAVLSGCDRTGANLGGRALRSGFGVMPMDFPVPENINFIVRANFDWTYRIAETTQGMSYLATIMAWVKAQT